MKSLVKKCVKNVADRGDKAIVVEVGLAVIAVVLLVFFKGAIQGMLENIISVMETNITSIFGTI